MARSHGGSVMARMWLMESGAPTNSGTSNAPAGILDLTPITAPPRASASVPRKGPAARCGNQSMATGAAAPEADHARATSDATSPTHATRRYCMTATSLMSPPKASAISTIAVAAPGDEPQTAVVPGSTFQRARAKPRPDARNMTAPIKVRNIGHFCKIVSKMSGVMLRATRQPTKPWATTNFQGGIPDQSLEPRNQDRGPDRAEQQSRGQAHQLEGRNADERGAQKCAPLQGRRSLAQCKRRHFSSQAPENASPSLSVMRAIRGKIRRIELSWASGAMLLVASLTMMST